MCAAGVNSLGRPVILAQVAVLAAASSVPSDDTVKFLPIFTRPACDVVAYRVKAALVATLAVKAAISLASPVRHAGKPVTPVMACVWLPVALASAWARPVTSDIGCWWTVAARVAICAAKSVISADV